VLPHLRYQRIDHHLTLRALHQLGLINHRGVQVVDTGDRSGAQLVEKISAQLGGRRGAVGPWADGLDLLEEVVRVHGT
jgi:hypothetical protein